MNVEERRQLWQLIRAQAKTLMELADEAQGDILTKHHYLPRQAIAHAQGIAAYVSEIASEIGYGLEANND